MKEKADDSINSLSEKDQISMVQHKPSNIKYIKDPSEAVQLAAIECSWGDVIRYIKNPTEEMQLIALDGTREVHYQNNKDAKYFISEIYGYIKNPTEKAKQLYKTLIKERS